MRREKDILALNAFRGDASSAIDPALRGAVDRRLKSFGPGTVLFYREPIRMVSAEGVWMTGADGRRYLDVYNNVPSVGHCHPRVVEAIARQAATLNVHTRYLSDVVDSYAERLLATFPAPIGHLVLTCTGSEANDLALRIARAATGGEGFVVTAAAYHGNTAAVTDVSPSSNPGKPLPKHVRTVPAPDAYRGGPDVGRRFAEDVRAAIVDLETCGIRVAALLCDTIFSSDGVHADPPGFLREAVAAVRAAGGLFIADEVQPGFGRTGASLWGFARHGVEPDIATMGKPMGNGFPVGGVATRPDLLHRFMDETRYFNTFGGNPVAAAAGLAVLDVIADEGLIDKARDVGAVLIDGFRDLAARHEAIGDVRGSGLFVGVELIDARREPAPDLAAALIESLRERGILIGAAGLYGNVLKVRPPLCLRREEAGMVLDACEGALREIAASADE